MDTGRTPELTSKPGSPNSGTWLQNYAPRPRAAVRLFCFSYAGGGASVYRLWHAGLPDSIEVCAVQLPGRETRLREPPVSSIPKLVDALVPVIRAQADRRFAFFGHSMGAVLACEVARALQAEGGPQPDHLFLSSRRPASVPDPDPPLTHLSDSDFVTELDRRYGGIPAEVRRHEELMALLLPGLRADLAALEAHVPADGLGHESAFKLAMPLTVFGGTDDKRIPRAHLEAWRNESTGAFRLRLFPGDHFYLNQQRASLLEDVRVTLAPMLAKDAEHLETA